MAGRAPFIWNSPAFVIGFVASVGPCRAPSGPPAQKAHEFLHHLYVHSRCSLLGNSSPPTLHARTQRPLSTLAHTLVLPANFSTHTPPGRRHGTGHANKPPQRNCDGDRLLVVKSRHLFEKRKTRPLPSVYWLQLPSRTRVVRGEWVFRRRLASAEPQEESVQAAGPSPPAIDGQLKRKREDVQEPATAAEAGSEMRSIGARELPADGAAATEAAALATRASAPAAKRRSPRASVSRTAEESQKQNESDPPVQVTSSSPKTVLENEAPTPLATKEGPAALPDATEHESRTHRVEPQKISLPLPGPDEHESRTPPLVMPTTERPAPLTDLDEHDSPAPMTGPVAMGVDEQPRLSPLQAG